MKESSLKAVVVSDAHGNNASLRKIAEVYRSADYLFHLGDYTKDALWLDREMPDTKTVFVRGNCDPGSSAPDFEEIVLRNNKIILTHGHLLKAKFSYDRLLHYAMEHEAKAILFGHTHRAHLENVQGIWLINPGSAGERARGDMSVAFMLVGEGTIVPKIVGLREIAQLDDGKKKI